MSNLTAIIPIDLSQRPKDIIKKSLLIAESALKHNVKIIFGHNDLLQSADKEFKEKLSGAKSGIVISGEFYKEGINTSLLRNRAFEKVDTKYVLLLDVDIWPDFALILSYLKKVEAGERRYYMLPCLYLTECGSKLLTSYKVSTSELVKRFFNYSRKEFLHLASPSSVTVLHAEDYWTLNGFDETFEGHGYEDFDFLIRLAALNGDIKPSADFLVSKSARSPLFAVGFRRYLGETCLEALMKKEIVFHVYHEKPKVSQYYSARPDNYKRMAALHAHRVGAHVPEDPTLISTFAKMCQANGQDIHGLSVLFDNKPGHVDRFDTFKRRLRFLLND